MIDKIYYTKIKNFWSAKNNLKKEKNTRPETRKKYLQYLQYT